MDSFKPIQRFLDEKGLLSWGEPPECLAFLAQRLRLLSHWELLVLASVLGFAVANLKALPLVHSLRLLPSLGRLVAPRLLGRLRGRRASQESHSEKAAASAPPSGEDAAMAAHPALFRHHATTSRAIPLDLDLNLHKSNSTFFADADVSRAALLTALLSDALAAPQHRGAVFVLAATQCKFLREIRPLQPYAVASCVLAWTDRALYTVTYFVSPRRGDAAAVCGLWGRPAAVLRDDGLRRKVFAILVSKYVFKAGRATVAPAAVLETAGLLLPPPPPPPANGHGNSHVVGKVQKEKNMLSADEVEKAVEEGLQFVRDCML